jgi:Ankyrin repeats (3 copies)
MTDNAAKFHRKLKVDFQDVSAAGVMIVLSLAANFSEYLPFELDSKYLIGGLAAVLAVALIKYLKVALVFVVLLLIVGAVLPTYWAPSIQYAPWMMTLTLTVLVVMGSLNKFRSVPEWLDPESDSAPYSERLHGAQAMFSAITHGRARSVRALLRQGVDSDVRAEGGETPLMYAASRNEDFIVQMLLDAGANSSLTNKDGYTALKVAEEKHLRLISALLQNAGAKE